MPADTERIRALNDAFRTTMTGGKVFLTAGVDALPSDVKAIVIRRVATFSEFNEQNDPHQEHDFGTFSLSGRRFFFKIDAYDANMEFGSEDPADPAKTVRVLTIMLPEECAPGKLACSSEVEDLTLPYRAGCG
jgi:Protein of unknown function (DUF3768)